MDQKKCTADVNLCGVDPAAATPQKSGPGKAALPPSPTLSSLGRSLQAQHLPLNQITKTSSFKNPHHPHRNSTSWHSQRFSHHCQLDPPSGLTTAYRVDSIARSNDAEWIGSRKVRSGVQQPEASVYACGALALLIWWYIGRRSDVPVLRSHLRWPTLLVRDLHSTRLRWFLDRL